MQAILIGIATPDATIKIRRKRIVRDGAMAISHASIWDKIKAETRGLNTQNP